MVHVRIKNIMADSDNNSFVVFLGLEDSQEYLPIWIGSCEGMSILATLRGLEFPRPMTHDLLCNTLKSFNSAATKLVISASVGGTYYSLIFIETEGEETVVLDSRPSDGIALAVRTGIPIYLRNEIDTIDPVSSPEKHRQLMDSLRPVLPEGLL